jgi:hypothetical protein
MVPVADHDFFSAAAAASGALIGLLFVALSVWRERDDERRQVEAHRLRASAALTAFTNALVVSLFALVPGSELGLPATIVATVGIASAVASALRLARLRRVGVLIPARDMVFVAGGAVLFVAQLISGIRLMGHTHRSDLVQDLADLVIFCLLYGIARSWELIGGPQVGVIHEVADLIRGPADEVSGASGADAADGPDRADGAGDAEGVDRGGGADGADTLEGAETGGEG